MCMCLLVLTCEDDYAIRKKKEINHWQMTFTLVKSVGQGHNCEENGRREDYYFLFFFL